MHEDRLWVEDAIAFQIEQVFAAIAQEKEITTEGFDGVALAAARLLQTEAREGVSINNAEYQARLDARMAKAGMNIEQRLRAQIMREILLNGSKHLPVDIIAPHWSDDPACCDPGGGMRSLDEIEEDEQF